jgi:hypothetical protein
LLLVGTGLAQFAPVLVSVEVPFEFNVGNKSFPAGEYWISRVAPYTLVLRDRRQRILTAMTVSPVEERWRTTPVLRFQAENGRHLLLEVWPGGSRSGFQLSLPRRRVVLAQQNSLKAQAGVGVQADAPTH